MSPEKTHLPLNIELRLGWSLAGVAGILNATGFCVAGFFSGNMTGNVMSLADRIVTGSLWSAMAVLAVILTFIAGGMIAALIMQLQGSASANETCALLFIVESVLLVILACIDQKIRTGSREILLYGLSFLLGLQNATAAVVSECRVRTTHVTGTSTDISVKLGTLIALMIQHRPTGHIAHLPELKSKVVTVVAFCAGGVLGVVAFNHVGKLTLVISAAAIVCLAVPPLFDSMRQGTQS